MRGGITEYLTYTHKHAAAGYCIIPSDAVTHKLLPKDSASASLGSLSSPLRSALLLTSLSMSWASHHC